jgi:hypothetical protein
MQRDDLNTHGVVVSVLQAEAVPVCSGNIAGTQPIPSALAIAVSSAK